MNKIINIIKSKDFGRNLAIFFVLIVFYNIIFAKSEILGIVFAILFIVYIRMALDIDSRK